MQKEVKKHHEQWSLHPGTQQRLKRGITAKQQQMLAKNPRVTPQAIFEDRWLVSRAFYADSNCLIFNAEVREATGWLRAAGLEVDCVVTSPPFYGQRDYNIDGQIGLEATPYDFIAQLVDFFGNVHDIA